MQVEPVEAVATLTAWHQVEATCLEHDALAHPADPLAERLPLLDPSAPDGGERTLLRLGTVDGAPVGAIELNVPTVDNLNAVSVTVSVLPTQRRRGHGRRLLTAALDEIAAMGRTRVFFELPSPYPDGVGLGESMLRSVDAKPVLKEVRRLLDLRDPTPPVPPAPTGYRVVQWVDRLPDEHLDDVAYLMHRMSTDAPLEDMDWEPEVWNGSRYRDKESSATVRGRTRVGTLALHEESGRTVAFTDIGVSRYAPEVAYQWETIVETAHRGHGLGFLLKAHNHRLLAVTSERTRWVNTWNAESNTHMVRINERLGFRPVEYQTEWQLDR